MLAQSLEFLQASGGIPCDLVRQEMASLARWPTPPTAFDASQHLIAAIHLCDRRDVDEAREQLIEMQLENGSWPASSVLRVPDQRAHLETRPHAEIAAC